VHDTEPLSPRAPSGERVSQAVGGTRPMARWGRRLAAGALVALWLVPAPALADSEPAPRAGAFALATSLDRGPLAGRVVLWAEAPVFDTAEAAAAWRPSADATPGHGWGTTLRVLAVRPGAVAAERLPPGERARVCAFVGLRVFEHYRLTVYAPRAGLLPVVSRTTEVALEDGTGGVLRAGTPVLPGVRAGELEVEGTSGFRASLPIPREVLGLSFEPAPELPSPGPLGGALAGGAEVYVGGQLAFTVPRDDGTRFPEPVHAVREDGDELVVALHDPRCLTLRARIAARDLSELEVLGHGIGGVGLGPPPWRVKIGAPVYWPDGREAGITEREMAQWREPRVRQGRHCWDWPASAAEALPPEGEVGHRLTLCHRLEDVVATPQRPRAPGGGSDLRGPSRPKAGE